MAEDLSLDPVASASPLEPRQDEKRYRQERCLGGWTRVMVKIWLV